jgi:hypothetical protein
MSKPTENLPDDTAELRAVIVELQAENAQIAAENAKMSATLRVHDQSSRERHDLARCQSNNTALRCPAELCAARSREGQDSLSQLSKELGINPKPVAKRCKRATEEDLKTGPKEPRSTVLSEAEEAMIVAFGRHTLLPLDYCLYALQPSLPHLTRSELRRCLQRRSFKLAIQLWRAARYRRTSRSRFGPPKSRPCLAQYW